MSHKCGDCGKKTGEYHDDGCDIERCPKCNGQLLSCDCTFWSIGEEVVTDMEHKEYKRIKVKRTLNEDFGI